MARNSNSYHVWSASAIKQIKKGDVIFFSTTKQSLTDSKGEKSVHHVGIVYSVDASNNSIVLIEGNTSRDMVEKKTYQVVPSTGALPGYKGHYFCGYISV